MLSRILAVLVALGAVCCGGAPSSSASAAEPTPPAASESYATPLAASVNPGDWNAAPSGATTPNEGTATALNKGEAPVSGASLELRIVSADGAARFVRVDARCAPTAVDTYTCSIGAMKPTDTLEVSYAFESHANAWIVATVKDDAGDWDTDVGSVK